MKWDDPELTKYDPSWKQEGQWWSGLDNYWAGAKKACEDIGMSLPDKSKLQSLAKKTTAEKIQLGLPTSAWFWSSSESYAGYAYFVDFSAGDTYGDYKSHSFYRALCVGD